MSWAPVNLGDVCGFVRGPFGGRLKKEIFKDECYAVYEQQHAINDQFSEIRYFVDEAKFLEMKRFELAPGDLIMSCSGTMGTVAKQMELILEMQTDQFWTDISADIREEVRRKLRMLADLIQPKKRKVVITDFEDEIGGNETIDLPEVSTGIDKARFKMKVRKFVETHMDHITLQKIHRAEALTRTDVEELQKMLIEQGVSDTETLSALQEEEPLGVFLRRLIGLDRAAAKQAFSAFMSSHQLNPDQTEFIDMIIDHLTDILRV